MTGQETCYNCVRPHDVPRVSCISDLRAAAEWLVDVGYPFDFNFTPRAPEALWQAIVDVVHEDRDGSLHGNELMRDQVAEWLVDP